METIFYILLAASPVFIGALMDYMSQDTTNKVINDAKSIS